jgi:4-amino-4-deoxy-L-arabinose transferase-like glycosyltransferase
VALLAGTAVLYLWNLAVSGWANEFYAAAAQAGSKSWTAFLYAASDAAASITVDKPPVSIWVMALSVRLFGLSSWSILVPQALMGVATVGVVYATVRRRHAAGTALLAGAALALTPVAALMFRFDNPDAMLVLLLTLAAAAVLRAVEDGRTRWMVAAGALVGAAFLTKQLQAFLVLPAFALTYLVAAPVRTSRRLRDGLLAVLALVVSAGWWVALVELVPASDRPWVGGSQTNSFLNLTFAYNGFGRLTGHETGSIGGGGWGYSGLIRLAGSAIGGQISWLLPAATVLTVAGLWLTRRAPRTDGHRAELLLWGGWLVVTAVTFSEMAGIFHAYYTVALAPAVAALVAIGGEQLWAHRRSRWAAAALAVTVLGTTAWASILLSRTPSWQPWVRPAVVVLGVLGASGILLATIGKRHHLAPIAAGLAVTAALLGPAGYSIQTAAESHTGAVPSAGPLMPYQIHAARRRGAVTARGRAPGRVSAAGSAVAVHPGLPPGGLAGGVSPATGLGALGLTATTGLLAGPTAGMVGNLLERSEPTDQVVALLLKNADRFTWVAATIGSNPAAGYQLATQRSVMPIGGFNGSDPSPTLAEFQALVAEHRIHWFIASGRLGTQHGGSNQSQLIDSWVTSTFRAQHVNGVTMYDLTGSATSAGTWGGT